MDIQFIGEKSTILTQYVTKYATKREITKSSETINEINSTKTLPQLLWKIAFRSLTHREVGALEAADTLLGISLHGTDSETIIKWLDVRMIRNRKLKTKEEIEELIHNDPESTEIFCPSLIDDYYPNRPKDLENLCLYNFAKWYDTTKTEPKNNLNEYYEIRPGLFLKKRLRGYLINHFRYNIANRPEDYFYSLLLLFQPWRNTDELKNGFETYTESFTHQQYMLQQANDYHEYNEEFGKEVHIIAKEINDAAQKHDNNNCTLADMIKNMNADQMKVFERIKNNILFDNTKLRLYVSGEGGTGKSFLINVIKRWIREELNRETVVTAPTGIAAFNINGLTIHRVLQLPVEHGFTPSYTQLSDNVLKALRDQLQNTTLFIIDEISMVSNITLIYIHLRLVEIFDVDDWFGGKHVVVFGDLLQLPPVHENPSYVTLSSEDAEKYVGSMCSLLSRVRVASMTNDDIKLLEQRKITMDPSLSYNEKLHEICNYIDKLPSDSVCLVPTCKQCDLINSVMTSKISSEEIILTARDHLDCNKSLIKKVSDTLNKIEDNASQSAGLAKTITIKIGAKVMLRRNIDVTLGLVNGAIGTVKSISKSIDGSEIQAINVDFGADTEYAIEKIKVKFQLFERAFVVREQFPLCLSYAVTIHKSQGLSLKNAIIEAGNTIFNVGQIYVALSRVTELRGLHLINFDPHFVKASSSAIKEYNRLRKIYRSDLPTIPIPDTRWQKVWDMIWAVEEHSIQIEPKNAKKASLSLLDCRGIENCDNVSDGLNSIIQSIFRNKNNQLNEKKDI
ncbi:ATP-dependent DNA helicase pif1-like [Cotesia typhae]|uniref:ATP-dependent DNA helicase pif1-like n=1 Tax=Cotesia typhae TaxID=2053667 RepID=UPI003D6841F9